MVVARRASSEFSRGVERSETPRNKCKIRCFRRNHLVARMMIPCRETIWGRFRGPGVSLRSTARLNLDFSLREKIFVILRVAVGAPGRAPALRGRAQASFHSPLRLRDILIIFGGCTVVQPYPGNRQRALFILTLCHSVFLLSGCGIQAIKEAGGSRG